MNKGFISVEIEMVERHAERLTRAITHADSRPYESWGIVGRILGEMIYMLEVQKRHEERLSHES